MKGQNIMEANKMDLILSNKFVFIKVQLFFGLKTKEWPNISQKNIKYHLPNTCISPFTLPFNSTIVF